MQFFHDRDFAEGSTFFQVAQYQDLVSWFDSEVFPDFFGYDGLFAFTNGNHAIDVLVFCYFGHWNRSYHVIHTFHAMNYMVSWGLVGRIASFIIDDGQTYIKSW